MDAIKIVFIALAVMAVSVGLIIGANEFGFKLFERYNPKYEQVRRTTYEQSRAFREGTIRDLENLALEYARGNDVQKSAIRATALHRLADVPEELLTPALRKFKSDMESN